MPKKSFKLKESFKLAYATSLVGRLGFYIAIPFIVAILVHNYLDKYFLDQYLIPDHPVPHFIIDFGLAIAVGVFSIWQIYKIILPFLDNK